jgi:hypothetical protein
MGIEMNAQHTPGPWSSPPNRSQYSNTRDLHDASGKRFAHIQFGAPGREMSDDEIEANARLIAAAPELLEAAQEMADLLDNLLRIGAINPDLIIAESVRNVLPIHRAAIAKATGSAS